MMPLDCYLDMLESLISNQGGGIRCLSYFDTLLGQIKTESSR